MTMSENERRANLRDGVMTSIGRLLDEIDLLRVQEDTDALPTLAMTVTLLSEALDILRDDDE